MDAEAVQRKFQKELNAGASALVVLGVLRRNGRAMYGYEIGKLLEERAGGDLPMHQGALYPTLRSLEKGGLLASQVEPSVSGPPRRYYHITPHGAQAFLDWIAAWNHTKNFVDSILEGTHGIASATTSGSSTLPIGTGAEPEHGAAQPGRGRAGRRRRIPAE